MSYVHIQSHSLSWKCGIRTADCTRCAWRRAGDWAATTELANLHDLTHREERR